MYVFCFQTFFFAKIIMRYWKCFDLGMWESFGWLLDGGNCFALFYISSSLFIFWWSRILSHQTRSCSRKSLSLRKFRQVTLSFIMNRNTGKLLNSMRIFQDLSEGIAFCSKDLKHCHIIRILFFAIFYLSPSSCSTRPHFARQRFYSSSKKTLIILFI